ncbi:MAG: leucine-rich repeat protein [Acutalibacteraceae bacterium]
MKRFLKSSLSIVLALTIILSSALVGLGEINFGGLFALKAEAASESDLTFTLNDDGESYSVTDCSSSASGEIVIPSTYNDFPVISIGRSAFYDCTSLTSITIPDSVTSIGGSAFRGCKNLTSVTIPDSVTSIGDDAFMRCENLTSITIPNRVTSIGNCAFEYCTSLTSVTIGNGVTSIGNYAFCECTNLTSITIPDSVTSVGNSAFEDCTSLISITIPDSVTNIGNYAFYDCTSLTSVTIGSGVTSIGEKTFIWCESLTSINVNENNADYSSINGVLFNKDKTVLVNYPEGRTDTEYAFPDSVTSIGDSAFYYCKSLTSITIPNRVTSIGNYAFYYCTSLTSVTIGSGVTSIGGSAFRGCESLTSVTIPDSVTSIGDSAFYYCTSLTSVTIGSGVTSIGEKTFIWCESLTSINVNENNADYSSINGVLFNKDKTVLVNYPEGRTDTEYTFPDSVTSIGNYAFKDCANLTSITIPDSVTSIGNSAFEDCTRLTSITIPDSVTSIGDSAFGGCTRLTSITIPNRVTSVGNYAFYYCTRLTSITIPDSVTSIGDSAFYYCTRLTSITIPDSLTSIGYGAFFYCESLTSVHITDIASWCNISFGDSDSNPLYYAKNLYLNGELVTDLVIPDGVTNIGDYAFFNCTSFITLRMGNGVKKVGRCAFQGCSNLNAVHISNLANWCCIDFFDETSNPLYYASNLYLNNCLVTNLIIPGTIPEILPYVFCNCNAITSVTLSNRTTVYSYAFYLCNNISNVYFAGTQNDWYINNHDPFLGAAVVGYNFLSLYSSYSLKLSSSNKEDSYAFIPVSDGKYVFYITSASSSSNPYMNLYTATIDDSNISGDINEKVIANELLSESTGTNSRIEIELEAGKIYCLNVGITKSSFLSTTVRFEASRIYTVSFDANGGENVPESVEKEDDTKITINTQVPTKECHIFKGWSLNENATEGDYSPGGTYCGVGDVTLYAVWQENHAFENWVIDYYGTYNKAGQRHRTCSECGYTEYDNNVDYQYFDITFICSGGSCDESSRTMISQEPIGVLPIATKTNFIFKGWTYTNGGTDYAAAEDIITENTTLYASWELVVPNKLEVSALPLKTGYFVNDELETRGLKLKVTYTDGSTKTITSGFETEYNFSSSGNKNVTINYTENKTTVSTSYEVYVNEPAQLRSESVEVTAGDTVDVPIILENNPGIVGFTVYVEYDDSVFTPVCVNGGDISGYGGMMDDNIGYAADNKVQVTWSGTENYYDDGEIFSITFDVLDEPFVRGDYTFKISYDQADTFDENTNDVVLECQSGAVTVINEQKAPAEIGGNTVEATAGKYVDIPVNVLNNNGLIGSNIVINYNSDVFTFVKITNGLATVSANTTSAAELTVNLNSVSTAQEGTLFTVRFNVKEYYSGEEQLILTSSISNVLTNDIALKITNPSADKPAVIYSDKISGNIGDTVLIPVYINNNHGLLGFKLSFTFDSELLTPVAYCKTESIISDYGTISNNISANIKKDRNNFDVIFYGSEEFCENGKMFTLKFTLNETIPIDTDLKIEYIQEDTYTEINGVETDATLDCKNVDFEIGGAFVSGNTVYLNKMQNASTVDLLAWLPTAEDGMIKNLVTAVGSYFGTGTTFDYMADGTTQNFSVVVKGDTNGDSVCDVLDAAQACLVSNHLSDFSDIQKDASDFNGDGEVSVEDYSAIVNMALT